MAREDEDVCGHLPTSPGHSLEISKFTYPSFTNPDNNLHTDGMVYQVHTSSVKQSWMVNLVERPL
jgi:hypothetical protein